MLISHKITNFNVHTGVFGTLDLHGVQRDVTWTQLAATVEAGDSEITVAVDTDWVSGDEIVVTSTSFEAWHTETFKISSRVDARTFTLNGTFAHMHTGIFLVFISGILSNMLV